MIKFILIAFSLWLCGVMPAYAANCEIVYGMRIEPYKPYEWMGNNDKPEGMNIDLLDVLSKQMNCTYRIVQGSREELLGMLESGEITMLSMSPTPDADRIGAYIPHSIVLHRYVLNRLEDPPIEDIEDWRGKTVLLIRGSHSQSYLETVERDYNLTFIPFDSHEEMAQALDAGMGDFFIATLPSIMNLPEGIDIKINGYPILPTVYGFVLHKKNSAMYTKMNMAMNEIKANGVYFDIMQRWTRQQDTPVWYKYIIFSVVALIIIVAGVLLWNKSLYVNVQRKTASLNNMTQLLQMLLDVLPEQITLTNHAGKPIWSNASVAQGASFSIDLIKHEIEQALATGQSFNIKRLMNNSETWMVSGIILDKESETQLLLVASNITESVRQRDDALMADRMAALGNMAANIAHEINNPMGLIMHNMNFLRQLMADIYTFIDEHDSQARFAGFRWSDAKAEGQSAQTIVGENIRRIVDTIADLKKFSKKRDNVYKSVDLSECITNSIRYINYFVRHYTMNFTCNIQGHIPPVNAHEQHIEQVVVNLIQNACYALTDKAQAITCTLALSDNGKYAVITVADEGRGMNEIVKKQAFEAFFTTRESGTGLGLSIVASIIKEHHGYYTLESDAGIGTAISVYLPLTNMEA